MSKKKMREEAAPAAEPKKDEQKAADASDAGHDVFSRFDPETCRSQDKELIKKMLVKHLGEEPNEEVMKHAHEAYMAACGSGMKQDEACETVGHAMKMAKIMHAHQAKQAESKDEAKPEDKEDAPKEAQVEEKKEAEEVKESAATPADEVIKLRGEVASLKESIKKRELLDYVDVKLAETKLPRAHTKTIKESLTACRSEAEVDQKITLFLEGFKAGSEAGVGLVESAEKTEGVKAGLSFADCVF